MSTQETLLVDVRVTTHGQRPLYRSGLVFSGKSVYNSRHT